MSDPSVHIADAAKALGLPRHRIWRLQREGFASRTSKGMVGLLGLMRGHVAALRDEAADTTPYASPTPIADPDHPVGSAVVAASARRLTTEAEAALRALNRSTAHLPRRDRDLAWAEISAAISRVREAGQASIRRIEKGRQ